jgi:hypothetical protein
VKTKPFKEISDFAVQNKLKRLVFLLAPNLISTWAFGKFLKPDQQHSSLQAAKFLVDAQKIYSARFFYFLPKFLSFALQIAETNLPNTYLQLLRKSVVASRRNPIQRRLIAGRVLAATTNLKIQQSSAHGWKLISLALTGFGFIRAGTVARKYCLEAALQEILDGKANSRTLHLAIGGLLECRRFDEAIHLIESHASNPNSRSSADTYGDYLELMGQRRPKLLTNKLTQTAPSDDTMSDLITGKSVALVATGEIKTHSGEEIDRHDTVARVKFQGFDIMPKSEFSGSRCDLSFYTEDLVDKFFTKSGSDLSYLDFLKDVKLIVLKQPQAAPLGTVPVRNLETRAPTFMTTATSGTLFLFDILRRQPKRVKLFGFNYYTERQIYNSALLDFYKKSNAYADIGLPKNWFDLSSHQKASATIASGFIPHDPRSDFLLVKNLYELSGLIDGTPEVLEILNLTADQYDARLEEMLGDW